MDKEKLSAILEEILPEFSKSGLNCAESVLLAMCRYWDLDAPFVPKIATAFGGGFAAQRDACGCLTGGLMAIGLKLGREAAGNREPAYSAGKALIEWVDKEAGSHTCGVLIGQDPKRPETMRDSRAPGGSHETVCRPLVVKTCEYLAENIK